jgi:hypothetical protein
MASLMLSLTIPCFAAPVFDTDSGPMFLHALAAASILAVFNRQRIVEWLRANAGLRTTGLLGFLFATVFASVATSLTTGLLHGPVPRFNDIFLVGIVVTCYLFSWESAVYLLVVSVLVSAWVLPPDGSLRVQGFNEWYRLISFTAVSGFMIGLITRIRSRRRYGYHAVASGD